MSMTPKEGEILSEIIDFLAKRDDDLALKLRDVVEALVEADAALSARIDTLADVLGEYITADQFAHSITPVESLLTEDDFAVLRMDDDPETFNATEPPTLLRRILSFIWSPAQ